MTLRLATRGSPLARWQADHVAGLLRRTGCGAELVLVDTTGDRDADRPIRELGGQGAFVKEVQSAVLDGRADVAVHSAKDLPSNPALQPAGLVLAAVPRRGDPRDALVGRRLADLAPGAVVATGSSRRRAQVADRRPDLTFAELRGNLATRLAKVPPGGALVMAAVALERLGLEAHVAEVLEPGTMLPQVGQGALALECRTSDDATRALLAGLEHRPSRRAVDAERGYLASLGGGCELPAAAHATVSADGGIRLRVLLATFDGRQVLRLAVGGGPQDDPTDLGRGAGAALLAAGGLTLLGAVGVPAGPGAASLPS